VRISIQQMETLYWVHRLGGINAAARHLNITQPTASLRIRELENNLGVRLIAREGRNARLTDDGAILFRYAERMLSLVDEIKGQIPGKAPFRGTLRLGAMDPFAFLCLPDLLKALELDYPDLDVELTVDNSTVLTRKIDARELDIAFIVETGINLDVRSEHLGNLTVAWIAGQDFIRRKRAISPRDMASEHILTQAPPSILNQVAQNWFSKVGLRPRRISTCNSLPAIVRLIAAGFGVGILPVSIIQAELNVGLLQPLRIVPQLQPLRLLALCRNEVPEQGFKEIIRHTHDVMDRTGFLPV
jgi:DNA-binding transcriptional LysR family regulator